MVLSRINMDSSPTDAWRFCYNRYVQDPDDSFQAAAVTCSGVAVKEFSRMHQTAQAFADLVTA
jgi:hypothetical protein